MECLSKFTRYNSVRPLATLSYASDLYNGSSIVSRYTKKRIDLVYLCFTLSGNDLNEGLVCNYKHFYIEYYTINAITIHCN